MMTPGELRARAAVCPRTGGRVRPLGHRHRGHRPRRRRDHWRGQGAGRLRRRPRDGLLDNLGAKGRRGRTRDQPIRDDHANPSRRARRTHRPNRCDHDRPIPCERRLRRLRRNGCVGHHSAQRELGHESRQERQKLGIEPPRQVAATCLAPRYGSPTGCSCQAARQLRASGETNHRHPDAHAVPNAPRFSRPGA